MKNENVKQKPKSPHRVKVKPVPDFITCPKCGCDIELWSDQDQTVCYSCGHKVFHRETTIH